MSQSQNCYDLIVCGGGVVGLSIAWWASRHSWKILVIDKGHLGKGASWHGAGILVASPTVAVVDPLEQLRALSHRLHPEWAAELLEQTGIDNGFRRSGGIYLGRSKAERATLQAQQAWWEEHGIAHQKLDPQELHAICPSLDSLIRRYPETSSWWLRDEYQIRNPRHLKALKEGCRLQGVEFIEDCQWQGWEFKAGDEEQVEAIQTSQGRFQADRFCVAAGAWSQQLLAPLGVKTGILPVRGQLILYRLDSPPFLQVINDGHRYLVPRQDGRVLAGSSEEEVGFHANTTEEILSELSLWASDLMPELQPEKMEQSWAGLRPGSFDSMPYLGTVPQMENLYVAAGHFRNGLHLSPGTAVTMFEWMSGIAPTVPLDSFGLNRGKNTLSN